MNKQIKQNKTQKYENITNNNNNKQKQIWNISTTFENKQQQIIKTITNIWQNKIKIKKIKAQQKY